jgi:hypothetical protein
VKSAFLGDALDHWKGALFNFLRDAGVLRDFAIDPMLSDRENWSREDAALYARLTGVEPRQLIPHRFSLKAREEYFAEIRHLGDLFLDPDTGVATGRVATARSYIMPRELGRLLDSAPERLLIVYQHVRAQRVRTRVDSVVAAIGREVRPFFSVSYESGTVAMLFLSRKSSRTAETATRFKALLGRHASCRIRVRNRHEV